MEIKNIKFIIRRFILIIFITFGLLISGCSNDNKIQKIQSLSDSNIDSVIKSSSTSLSVKKIDSLKKKKKLKKKKRKKKRSKKKHRRKKYPVTRAS